MSIELIHGVCLQVMPALGGIDAVITDPPYGINHISGGGRGSHGWSNFKQHGAWDLERPPKEVFDAMRRLADTVIIWGGNYFTDYLPPTMQWLVWDKGQRKFSLADCELAWSSQNKAARVFTYARAKALQDGKVHPTQKPIALMEWTIQQCKLPLGSTILDPYMGSGSTGIAAVNLGYNFVGVEIDKGYYEIAKQRINAAQLQTRMEMAA